MSNKYFLVFLAFLFSVSVYSQHGRHRNSLISAQSETLGDCVKILIFAS